LKVIVTGVPPEHWAYAESTVQTLPTATATIITAAQTANGADGAKIFL